LRRERKAEGWAEMKRREGEIKGKKIPVFLSVLQKSTGSA